MKTKENVASFYSQTMGVKFRSIIFCDGDVRDVTFHSISIYFVVLKSWTFLNYKLFK
jgi:hypothetical protein